MPKPPGKRVLLQQWLDQNRPALVTPADWNAIRMALAPVSDSYLRRLLRESGAQLHCLVEGVRQETLESLERSLLALLQEYDAGSQKQVRKLIIEAKDHAGFALKKHPEKAEMILWMRTWLENPGIFPQWLAIRKETLRAQTEATETTGT